MHDGCGLVCKENKKSTPCWSQRSEVNFEVYDFYHEDFHDLLSPLEYLEKLPNPLLLETLMYADESRNEWIRGVALDEETKGMLYEARIKNGEPVAYDLYI